MFRIVDSVFWNVVIIIVIVILCIVIVLFIIDKIIKFWPTLKETTNWIVPRIYLILLPFPLFYLFYFYVLYDEGKNPDVLIAGQDTLLYLEKISIYFFSAGIFSATFKLINSLVVFKKHFKDIIISKEFDKVLSDKLEVLALSDDYLLQRSDLHDIWARISLCKYEQKFPQIKEALKSKMANDLFHENNLSYYYKNFRTQINFKLLDNDIVRITEISNFTIVASSTDPIILDFWIDLDETDSEDNEIYTKYIPEKCKMDGTALDIISLANSEQFQYRRTFNATLKDKKEYEIERSVEFTQYLEKDRVFSFSSSRIIDNLSIKINHCEKLNIFFSPVDKNKFILDNQITEGQSYLSREILLSGEKFKTFIFKKKNS